MAHKTKNPRGSGKAGPTSLIIPLEIFLNGGSQYLHTYLFSMEFGRKKRALLPYSFYKSSGASYDWVWLGHVPTVARDASRPGLGFVASLETSPIFFPTLYTNYLH